MKPHLLLLAAVLIAGCSRSAVKEEEPPNPNEGVKLVQVNVFDTSEVANDTDVNPDQAARSIAQSTVNTLREFYDMRGKLTQNAAPTPDTVTLNGKLVRIHGGSRAARTFAPGSSPTVVTVEGEAYRGDQLLGNFRATAKGRWGFWFGGSSAALADDCVKYLGEVIAEMVANGEYRDNEK